MENVPHPVTAPELASPRTAFPLERYGRYQLFERIGKGGMAEVFLAITQGVEGFRRVFVVKRIRPDKSTSPDFIQMFCDEARINALLHHPNIVQVYDFGQINGTYFLAMEYLRGKDLSSVMRVVRGAKAAIEPPLAAYVAEQVARGLHHAHALSNAQGQVINIVHRDITPSNIMLLRTGGVKIMDFGIAKAASVARHVDTRGGQVKGKLSYLSPEQVRAGPIDGRSDVFTLGVVLWEMLAGQRLFSGENEFQTMRNVLHMAVPPPSTKHQGIPADLDRIVARALERSLEKRYGSAQEMADDLEHFLQSAHYHNQSMPRLLQDLFGEEASDPAVNLPDIDGALLAPPSVASPSPPPFPRPLPPPFPLPSAEGSVVFDDEVLELDPDSMADGDPSPPAAPVRPSPSRRVMGAAAATVLVACLSWAAWKGTRSHAQIAPLVTNSTAASPVKPPPSRSPTPTPTPTAKPLAEAVVLLPAKVSVTIDSAPAGASIHDEQDRLLGITPVTLSLGRTSDPIMLKLEKSGYQPVTYGVTPDRDRSSRIDLSRLPSAAEARNSRRKTPRALSNDVTFNPFE